MKQLAIPFVVTVIMASLASSTAFAGCTSVYGIVQPYVTGCSYSSNVWEVCYQGNTYGYAWMEMAHRVVDGWDRTVYSQILPGQFGSILEDTAWHLGWPRECVWTTGIFYIQDPDPPAGQSADLLNGETQGCGCLEQCV